MNETFESEFIDTSSSRPVRSKRDSTVKYIKLLYLLFRSGVIGIPVLRIFSSAKCEVVVDIYGFGKCKATLILGSTDDYVFMWNLGYRWDKVCWVDYELNAIRAAHVVEEIKSILEIIKDTEREGAQEEFLESPCYCGSKKKTKHCCLQKQILQRLGKEQAE